MFLWHYLKKDIPRREEEGAVRIGSYLNLVWYLALSASNLNCPIGFAWFAVIITAGRSLRLR